MRKISVWEEEAEGASIQQGLDFIPDDAITSDTDDDNEFMMGEEQTDIVTDDSKKDYATGIAEDVNRREDPVLVDMKPEPWTDAWELTARRSAGYVQAFDIDNFEKEDADGSPMYGPVHINISILLEERAPAPEDQRMKLSEHIRSVVSQSLEMPAEQVSVDIKSITPPVTPIGKSDEVDVMVAFDGIDPDEEAALNELVEGLVLEAVMSYSGF
jgi:hypothetical protein